jgi:hypothetical protein
VISSNNSEWRQHRLDRIAAREEFGWVGHILDSAAELMVEQRARSIAAQREEEARE